jgi:GntR family transcriptional regulator, transcriptional repressor for pyruvate dehydrogenase complex
VLWLIWFKVSVLKLAAIERRSTVEQVVERIADVIREKKLSAGTRLPGEHELVQQLQVSRPVLREALSRLHSLGLVDIQRGKGTFVGDRQSLGNCVRLLQSALTISPHELRAYAEMRTAIEVQAVRQAAVNATDKDVRFLANLLKQLDDDELAYPIALEIDFQFHRKLIDMSGNPLMQNTMEVIHGFVLAQMARTTPSPRENQFGRRLHKAILRAVREHNPESAEKAMRTHMEAVLSRLD